VVFGLVAVAAGAVAALSGFGIGSLLTPFLLVSFPMAEAVAIVAVPHVAATAVRFWRLRADVDRPTFRQFGIASAAGGLAGATLQPILGSGTLAAVLAGLLVMAGGAELLRRPVPLPTTRFWRLTGGAVSGVFGGLVGNQGGIRAAALLGFQLPTRALVVGTFLGVPLLSRIPPAVYRQIVGGLLVALGIALALALA